MNTFIETKGASAQSSIIHPLLALVAINTKHTLLKRKVILPILAAGFPVLLLLLWRAVWFVYPNLQGRFDGGYTIYSVLCASFYMQFLLPILSLMKGLTIFSEERDEGTLMYLFLRPVPRWVLVTGKYLGFWLSTAIILAVSLFMSFLLLGTINDLDMFIYDFPVFVKDLWVLALGLAAYGALLMVVGVFFKKGMGIGILFFIWDFAAAYIPGSAYRMTIKHYLQSIFPHQRTESGLAELLSNHPPTSTFGSVFALLLVIVVCIALTTLIMKWKEFGASQNVD